MPTVPPNATPTLHVTGIPSDVTERELGHIFRPFPGFRGLRLKPPREPGRGGPLAFVDFEQPSQALVCLRAVDGYRVDGRPEAEQTAMRLRVEFAKAPTRNF